jgi:hypothetical protein
MMNSHPIKRSAKYKPLATTTLHGTTYFIDEEKAELRNTKDSTDAIRFDDVADLQEYRFWTEQLQFIIGRRVKRAELVYDETMDGWKPVILFDDGQALEMLRDEEGNGPGRFSYIA